MGEDYLIGQGFVVATCRFAYPDTDSVPFLRGRGESDNMRGCRTLLHVT